MAITRRQAIATTGVAGASLLVARGQAGAWLERAASVGSARARANPQCVLTGARTQGPFFVDEKLNRSDIRVDPSDGTTTPGIPLALSFVVLASDAGCAPIEGAQVDVWHCNANGDYSDVPVQDSGPGGAGDTRGKKYLRGFQRTDANGVCAFTTIFPGWYMGRSVHIHFKIRSGTQEFDSQLFFDEQTVAGVNSTEHYKGNAGRRTNAQDDFYGSDGPSLRVEVTGDNTSGYRGTYTVGLRGFPGTDEDSVVAAAVGRHRFERTRAGKRTLAFEVLADEEVTVSARLLRGGRVLAQRGATTLAPGARTVRVTVPRRTLKGDARLQVTVVDAAGNRTVVGKRVSVPRRRT